MSTTSEQMNIKSPTLHLTILITILVFVTILIISFVFKIEVVAKGQGRILPISRVQVVQPEFSGRIAAIHINNGTLVEQGQLLIEFDPTDAISELGTIKAEKSRLQIEMARVQAMVEALGVNPEMAGFTNRALGLYSVPSELARHPFAEEQRELLIANINSFLKSIEQVDARVESYRSSEEVTNAKVAHVSAMLDIQSERLQAAERLLEQGTISRFAFLDVQEAFTELERQREVYLSELRQKVSERTALESERQGIIANLRSSQLDRKAQIDARLATLAEQERVAIRRVGAANLKAPVTGIVDQLAIFTVGGVAQAGNELLRIVPTEVEVEVEGRFSNQDIGFMEVGQQANIRLDAYPSERFGFLQGEILDIAADSSEVQDGQWYYPVRISPSENYLEFGTNRFPLRPGMTVTIFVTTDTRRLISYFFAPIVATIQNALGER
ncbi:hypothetical protein LH51_05815 [Nitrincola sp. A-D6]|uniref:HlyD family type I secretion periplasmic adaptor subunit n=1 Tax=Nitrincola sp. A-D6 TaxID=1545442 RepID=UPI00051FC29A|nr:HlyD family type I secretion periplasmic adaptor subunit [Nitrincola sp. A-D6]KGK42634.1 hypothetical protein LH51_05815 [Nitrincola sp. A-D6]